MRLTATRRQCHNVVHSFEKFRAWRKAFVLFMQAATPLTATRRQCLKASGWTLALGASCSWRARAWRLQARRHSCWWLAGWGSAWATKVRLFGQGLTLCCSSDDGLWVFILVAGGFRERLGCPGQLAQCGVCLGWLGDCSSGRFLQLEGQGLAAAGQTAFVLVAGGLGERLGYRGAFKFAIRVMTAFVALHQQAQAP